MGKGQKIQKRKRDKAQAMVVVFVYISVVSLMGVYMMVYASNLHSMVIREINHTQAFYAGEAALIQSFAQLSSKDPNSGLAVPGDAAVGPITFGQMSASVTGADAGQGYTRIRAIVTGWQAW